MESPVKPVRAADNDAEPAPRASILLVDDRPANLLTLQAILDPLGHEIVLARSGEEALSQLLQRDFALILMDVQMPKLDGLATARLIKMRVSSRHIPIIFLTAFDRNPEYVFEGYAHGAVDYLMKPFQPEILRSKVSVFVELFVRGEQIKRREVGVRLRERAALERRNEMRFRTLTEAMPQWVLATRPDGRVYYSNRPWDVVGSALADIAILHSDDRDRVRVHCEAALPAGLAFEFECRFEQPGAASRWFLVRAVPERDDDGTNTGWIVTGTDIDDQKQVEQRLEELLVREQGAREAAEAASRAKDEFLATVSHELRTPLSAVVGWTQMLRKGLLKQNEVDDALATVERCAKAQLRLIQDIMDVSRATMGKLQLEMRPVLIDVVLAAAVDSLRPAAEAKGVSVEVVIPDDLEAIAGDPERLQQVVGNVLSNAIKFTPKGGNITASLARVDSCMVIRVCDDGEGIRPDFLPYVFEPFRQADGSSTRVHGGLGLGLAIVRRLVELHGGTARAESAGAGLGSTFTIVLPIGTTVVDGDAIRPPESEANAVPRVVASLDRGQVLGGLRVMVVDDDPDSRTFIAVLLQQSGAEVTTCESAAACLEMLARATPDVLISDLAMPHDDGLALIRRIRSSALDARRIPALALTAYGGAEDTGAAIAAGFDALASKPVDGEQLTAVVARLAEVGTRRDWKEGMPAVPAS